jgi:nitrate reductase delta subunit
MTATFKALAALLTYPQRELIQALPEIASAIEREERLAPRCKAGLQALVMHLAEGDLLDLQEHYVDLFDRGRKTSLHLFEHVHGDSRERGQAMIDLKEVYAKAGLELCANELPDYLPAVFEFLSQRPYDEAQDMLTDCAHILRAIGESVMARGSAYQAVFAAALAMVDAPGLATVRPKKSAKTEKTLDEEWIDEPVIFGPAAGASCGAKAPATAVMQFMPRRS